MDQARQLAQRCAHSLLLALALCSGCANTEEAFNIDAGIIDGLVVLEDPNLSPNLAPDSFDAFTAADFGAKLQCDRDYDGCVSQCAVAPQVRECRAGCVRSRTSCYSRAGYDADGRPKRPQQSPIID